jgi:uncharacterized protein (TIGR02300 family)
VSNIKERDVVKPEWGTKRTCPKCGERFYDLGNDDPCVCIACGVDFKPEPVLKTKQPIVAVVKKEEKEDEDEDGDDIDLDAGADNAVSLDNDDDTEVAAMVDTKLSTGETS